LYAHICGFGGLLEVRGELLLRKDAGTKQKTKTEERVFLMSMDERGGCIHVDESESERVVSSLRNDDR
jgi:hypothetical protein